MILPSMILHFLCAFHPLRLCVKIRFGCGSAALCPFAVCPVPINHFVITSFCLFVLALFLVLSSFPSFPSVKSVSIWVHAWLRSFGCGFPLCDLCVLGVFAFRFCRCRPAALRASIFCCVCRVSCFGLSIFLPSYPCPSVKSVVKLIFGCGRCMKGRLERAESKFLRAIAIFARRQDAGLGRLIRNRDFAFEAICRVEGNRAAHG